MPAVSSSLARQGLHTAQVKRPSQFPNLAAAEFVNGQCCTSCSCYVHMLSGRPHSSTCDVARPANTREAAAPALAAAAITLSFTSQPFSCMAWESTGMAGATNTAAGSTWYFSRTAVTCSTSSSWGGVMSMRQASTACYFVHDTQISG